MSVYQNLNHGKIYTFDTDYTFFIDIMQIFDHVLKLSSTKQAKSFKITTGVHKIGERTSELKG